MTRETEEVLIFLLMDPSILETSIIMTFMARASSILLMVLSIVGHSNTIKSMAKGSILGQVGIYTKVSLHYE
jgi:hypothetical protein